jgi:anti-anti-sigma regulatory factor
MIERDKPRIVLLDCQAVIDLEYTAWKMLSEADVELREARMELWLAGPNPSVRALVERSGLGAALGHRRILLSVEAAVEKYQQRSGK